MNRFPRVIGRAGRVGYEPRLAIVGGLHGNEPAGALAASRVMREICDRGVPVRGDLLALAGNLGALAVDRRYLARDLNRAWRERDTDELRQRSPANDRAEDTEQRALLGLLEKFLEGARSATVLDLHSFSSPGPPFTIMADTLRNREAALALPLPVILGLEERVDGTLLEFFTRRGHAALVVEGGSHADPQAVDCHEAVIWIALVAEGLVAEAHVPRLEQYRRRLENLSAGLPRFVEVVYRHGLEPGDGFQMRSGFRNFQSVVTDQALASSHRGPVRCPRSGVILMPLYQEQGDDGYFLGRPVRPVWMGLSRWLRRAGLPRAVPLLPGVHRHPTEPDFILVDRRIARWLVVQVFHLLGFRLRERQGKRVVFARREQRA